MLGTWPRSQREMFQAPLTHIEDQKKKTKKKHNLDMPTYPGCLKMIF